jgi:hypothetical protein
MSREGHNYWECALHGDSLSADKLDRGRHTTLSGGAFATCQRMGGVDQREALLSAPGMLMLWHR